jgi:DNA/RNA-binding domain of Phe-tRNA-synthetase-like protein
MPSINPLVDLYNAVSLRYLLPVGGEDLDRLQGHLTLRFAGETEPEVALLGRPEPAAPEPGEVIYADDAGAVCRRWNWREAARTCLSEDTRNAILVVELLPPTEPAVLDAGLAELAVEIERRCGGKVVVSVLGRGAS